MILSEPCIAYKGSFGFEGTNWQLLLTMHREAVPAKEPRKSTQSNDAHFDASSLLNQASGFVVAFPVASSA